jgi:2-methylisocitrate lyase-like PEP mutase family enzyme
MDKAVTLAKLHTSGPMLVLPNAWDAGSARIFVEAGFPALATTSAGIAFSLGYADGEIISRAEMLAAVARITARVTVPVTADMEAGFGRAAEVVAETAQEAGVPLVINARTDAFHPGTLPQDRQITEAVKRGNAYRAAGADCVFVPFVGDSATIERIVTEIDAPVNILGAPDAPNLQALEAMGVRRVTFGSAPMRATLGLVRRMAREWKDKGTYGTLAAYGIPFKELQQLFG